MTDSDGGLHLRRPHMDDFVFEGEETPVLLRPPVVIGLILFFLALVAAYVIAVVFFDVSLDVDAEPFQEWVEDLGWWGPLAYMGLLALSVLIAPIPNAPIFVAAGLVWGPVLGTVYSMGGMALGSIIAFYAARWVGRRHLARLVGHKAAERLDDLAERMGGRLIFWARMLPAVNFDYISFLAGLTSIRFWTFFLYSMLGMLLPTTVAVVAGDGLGKDIRITLFAAGLWVAGIAASAGYFWYRHRRSQSARRLALSEER
ncbi:MAG: TVP38/TMEM64 family protein [Dehalococcoidia bacterium]